MSEHGHDSSRAVDAIIRCIEEIPQLLSTEVGDEFYYASLPLCVLDAVYSVGIRYEAVQAVVERYCEYYKCPRLRPDRTSLPPREDQVDVETFIRWIDGVGVEAFARDVVRNRSLTSTRKGILKAQAVRDFAHHLKEHGVYVLQDMGCRALDKRLEASLCSVHGQGSGISVSYFFMLAGSEDLVKPDRMIVRFLAGCLGTQERMSARAARKLLTEACRRLQPRHPDLTPRKLDYAVWSYQRVLSQ